MVSSSADAAEKVLKTYDHIFASRPHHEESQYLAYEQKNLVFAKYGAYWRNMRKLCTVYLLSNHKIHSFQSMRKRKVELLVESLKKEAHDRITVDISAKGLTRTLKDVSKVFDELLEWIIDEHVEYHGRKQTKDFVDTMMDIMQSGEANFQFDHRHIKDILLDMLLDAMDTTTSST
ncbi:hypothetical protein HAX54_042213 [Datura stramonium]|uniref:Cytochrome P450 n=1 Tax=Datura stramonium TaxID=4076 RepID=A0ABS8SLS7_DATST|nr:hypothetical protein [Datura stramonium]